MNRYVDIRVTGIQRWLAKAPGLKGRRGASTMIREATVQNDIAAHLARDGSVRINREAGEVDGVLHLVVEGDAGDPIALVRPIVLHMRRSLPHATLHVIHTEGEDYVAATSVAEQEWPPAVLEWPLARPCDWCRAAPAHDTAPAPENAVHHLCVECLLRNCVAGGTRVPPGPEKDLLDKLSDKPELVDTFPDLVALGPENDRTHLATVYADGNSIGAVIDALRRARSPRLDGIERAIQDATWAAVVTGVEAVVAARPPAGKHLPVVPHLVGGDDILVSMPAHDAWNFVSAAMAVFAERLVDLTIADTAPSLSASVVFHHHKFPLGATVDLAAKLLADRAKAGFPGRAAIAWQSVTHDGVEPAGRALSHEVFVEHRAALAALAAVPTSQRQGMARLLADPGSTPEDLDRHVTRMDLTGVVLPFRRGGGLDLADALAMLRWWRP